jgi:hypothetical protein
MEIKGSYKLIYSVDKHEEELRVDVELKPNEFPLKPFQNVYRGIAYVNGAIYNGIDISHSVNAKIAAEEIGLKLKEELKKNLRQEGKSFRLKKEEIK